jgi:hypothetical protein
VPNDPRRIAVSGRALRNTRHRWGGRIALVAVAAVCVSLAGSGPAGAELLPSPRFATASTNWAGYAVTSKAKSFVRFRSVSGEWVQPAVTCAASPSYSGFWVGLGGYGQSSKALEQTGTEADCSTTGQPQYFAWSELVPKGPVKLALRVSPGDRIRATVTVLAHEVTFGLRDVSSGAAYSRRQRVATTDVSSAEWIAEAPSTCNGRGNCRVLPIANFGSVAFTGASATSTTPQTGSIAGPTWTATALELRDLGFGIGPARLSGSPGISSASPSSLTEGGTAFAVTWQQAPASATPSTPIPVPGG